MTKETENTFCDISSLDDSPVNSTEIRSDSSTKDSPLNITEISSDNSTKDSPDNSTENSPDNNTEDSPDNSTENNPHNSTEDSPDNSTENNTETINLNNIESDDNDIIKCLENSKIKCFEPQYRSNFHRFYNSLADSSSTPNFLDKSDTINDKVSPEDEAISLIREWEDNSDEEDNEQYNTSSLSMSEHDRRYVFFLPI